MNQNPTSIHTPKQSHKDTQVSQAQVGKMRRGLDQMMGLFRKAEEKIQAGIWKVIGVFFGK